MAGRFIPAVFAQFGVWTSHFSSFNYINHQRNLRQQTARFIWYEITSFRRGLQDFVRLRTTRAARQTAFHVKLLSIPCLFVPVAAASSCMWGSLCRSQKVFFQHNTVHLRLISIILPPLKGIIATSNHVLALCALFASRSILCCSDWKRCSFGLCFCFCYP